MEAIISESITARLISDKPVIKTPYQVKGVFFIGLSETKRAEIDSDIFVPIILLKVSDLNRYWLIVSKNSLLDLVLFILSIKN